VVDVPFIAVCSAKPRPMVQSSRSYMLKTGATAWGRDVHHILDGDGSLPLYRADPPARTLCGRKCPDWLVIGPMTEIARDCCVRCAVIAKVKAK
jgi:hypothetical protein